MYHLLYPEHEISGSMWFNNEEKLLIGKSQICKIWRCASRSVQDSIPEDQIGPLCYLERKIRKFLSGKICFSPLGMAKCFSLENFIYNSLT